MNTDKHRSTTEAEALKEDVSFVRLPPSLSVFICVHLWPVFFSTNSLPVRSGRAGRSSASTVAGCGRRRGRGRRAAAPGWRSAPRRAARAAPRQKCGPRPKARWSASGAADVEAVGIGETRRIAIGGAEQAQHDAAAAQRTAAKIDVVGQHDAVGGLHRAVVAQELLDRAADQAGSSCRRRRWSGWRSSASTALAIRLVVVSWPAPRIRPQSATSSVPVDASPCFLDGDQGADQIVARCRRRASATPRR